MSTTDQATSSASGADLEQRVRVRAPRPYDELEQPAKRPTHRAGIG
jgi:hypothetical protein